MANWNKPALPDQYPDFLDSLSARDLDSGTMFLVDPTNPPVGVIRFNRTTNLFQEWNGSTWVNKVISQAGGGTGAGNLPALGTMASQNANNVAITGGDIRGLSYLQSNGEIQSGSHARVYGLLLTGSGQIQLTDATGKIPAINSSYFTNMDGQGLTNMNASQLTHGTVNVNRMGSGAVGSGRKVLVDNGTWIEDYRVGGGMVEIVHNDTSFGSGETFRDVPILWAGPMPTSTKKIDIRLNSVMSNIGWKVLTVNQFRIILNAEAPGTVINWTAYHYITQV